MDVNMNSVKLRRELDVAARQLPLKRAGAGVAATTTSTPGLDSLFTIVVVAAAAAGLAVFVSWASEDEVDIEHKDEVECEVEANAADDCGGVSVAGVDGAAGDDEPFAVVPDVDVVVVALVSSCFMR